MTCHRADHNRHPKNPGGKVTKNSRNCFCTAFEVAKLGCFVKMPQGFTSAVRNRKLPSQNNTLLCCLQLCVLIDRASWNSSTTAECCNQRQRIILTTLPPRPIASVIHTTGRASRRAVIGRAFPFLPVIRFAFLQETQNSWLDQRSELAPFTAASLLLGKNSSDTILTNCSLASGL